MLGDNSGVNVESGGDRKSYLSMYVKMFWSTCD